MGFNILTGLNSKKILNSIRKWNPNKPTKKDIENSLGKGKTSKIIKQIIQRNYIN